METTLLSSKGQVVIPKAIRASHQWKPGTRFVLEEVQGGILLKPVSPFVLTDLHRGLGCVGYTGPRISLDEMNAAIAAEADTRWRADNS